MKEQPIRIGIIGAGENTRKHHIPKLQAQDGVEIVGVVNRSRESSERAAKEFGIPRIYEEWTQAVEDPETDAIVIGTWPYLHAPATLAALGAGKHVMTEARMACDAREAHAMWRAARERPHLVAQVVPAPFSLGVDATMRRLVAEGYIGDPLVIEHHQSSADFINPEAPLHWRKNREWSGLNIMMLGIVYEMIMRWVGEATRVMAMSKTFVRMRRTEAGKSEPVHVPDHLDVLADMACGAQLHLQQSEAMPYLQGGGTYLFGSEGVLRFHDGVLYGGRRGDGGLTPIEIPENERGGWRVEEEFVHAIRGREPIRYTTFEDGVKYMEFTEAVSLSMTSGRDVALPLDLDAD